MSLRDQLHQITAQSLAQPGLTWSVFLDISPPQQEEALLFLQAHARALLPKLEALGEPGLALKRRLLKALSLLPRVLLEAQQQGHHGLALFVSQGWGPHLLPLPLALPNREALGQQVALGPLLGPMEALDSLVCVHLTPQEARLYDLGEGQAQLLERARATLRGDLLQEATAALLRWARRRPSLVLVLLGEATQARALLDRLGEAGRERTLALLPPQRAPEDPDFLHWLLSQLQQERALPPRPWPQEALYRLEHALPGVLVGSAQVWDALSRRPQALRVILLAEEGEIEGWCCAACQAQGAPPRPPACLSCGAHVDRGDLRPALLRRAAQAGLPCVPLEPDHDLLRLASAFALAAEQEPAQAQQQEAGEGR